MPDYKELYGKLYRATEKAAFLLRQAQEECEAIIAAELEPAMDTNVHSYPLEKEDQT